MILVYTVLVVLVFVFYVKWRLDYWNRRGLYQLNPEFFFGNTRADLFGRTSKFEVFVQRYSHLKSLNQKHGGMYCFTDPWYIPVDLKLIKNIFQKDFSYFNDHGMYYHPKDTISMNLFNLVNEDWKNFRSKLTPLFSSAKLKSMFQILVDKAEVLEEVIGSYSSRNEPLNIEDLASRFTIDVITSCGFGIETNALKNSNKEFMKCGVETFNPGLLKFVLMEVVPSGILANLGFTANGAHTNNLFNNLISEVIQYREKNRVSRNDFLQLFLELKQNQEMTDDQIIAQCFGFFAAGFETTSITVMFAMLELALNQEIQHKLRDEIEEVLEKYDGNVCYDAVMEMNYLDKVLNETLRKYPPGPIIPRKCTKTYRVPETDVTIEKGTRVLIPIWGLHRDPEFYPDPEQFNPENFNAENKANRPEMAFIPFGEGPRMCIGLRFGLLETKLALIKLLKNFKYTLNGRTKVPIEIDPEAIFTLKIKGDLWLDVTKI